LIIRTRPLFWASRRVLGGQDEVEPDDESLDDATLIEESERDDGDVTEIIGDDIDAEEGN
jgi:hypothetical protein